ncbi:MAG: hypothetical protein RI894_1729, partial [Bacteroidota bacterium]
NKNCLKNPFFNKKPYLCGINELKMQISTFRDWTLTNLDKAFGPYCVSANYDGTNDQIYAILQLICALKDMINFNQF